jgi:cytochrome b561
MRKLKPTEVTKFDLLSVLLHWLIAVFVLALFTSGVWMVDLGYYDDWYYRAPWWHTGIGVVTFCLLLSRWLWMLFRPEPTPIDSIPNGQQRAAKLAHFFLNVFVLCIALTGYLMVTLKGDSLSVFDWFVLPSLIENRAWVDTAGELHEWLAYILMGIVTLHVVAALKHHFVDKDATLLRMLNIEKGEIK